MEKKKIGLSSSSLHIIAMALMLCDHIWGTLWSNWDVLTIIGRLAFPIFAFLFVEGYFYTSSKKKYLARLIIFGLISEVPFDLMISGSFIYYYHQNVMFELAIGLITLYGLDQMKERPIIERVLLSGGVILLGFVAGTVFASDYFGPGILMIVMFYYTRTEKWWKYIVQILVMYYINFEMFGGLCYQISIYNFTFTIAQQGFAILALPIIWLYNGKKGYSSKWFKYFCYSFYPIHMTVLVAIMLIIMSLNA